METGLFLKKHSLNCTDGAFLKIQNDAVFGLGLCTENADSGSRHLFFDLITRSNVSGPFWFVAFDNKCDMRFGCV